MRPAPGSWTAARLILVALFSMTMTSCIAADLLVVALNSRVVRPGEELPMSESFEASGVWSLTCSPAAPSLALAVRLIDSSGRLVDAGEFSGTQSISGSGSAGGRVDVVVANHGETDVVVTLVGP